MSTPHAAQAFFITGTDTEVGKTFVTAALLRAFAQQTPNAKVVGMKPIAAGTTLVDGVAQNEDVAILNAASSYQAAPELVCPYLLEQAAAPHIAAALEGISLASQPICSALQTLRMQADVVLVEGVGGYAVPLSLEADKMGAAALTTADLCVALDLPVILVVGLRLGCLNHALLTAQAIQASGLKLIGWVGNTLHPDMPYLQENIDALHRLLPAPCWGVVPYLAGNAEDFVARLDSAAQQLTLAI